MPQPEHIPLERLQTFACITDQDGNCGGPAWGDETRTMLEVWIELVLRSSGVQSWLWVPLACVFARQCSLLFNARTRRHWRHKAASGTLVLCHD